MSIKRRLGRFDQKGIFSLFFLYAACLPAALIMHVPISKLHAQWLILQHEFELSTFPSIPPNDLWVAYVNSCFIIIRQDFYPVSFL